MRRERVPQGVRAHLAVEPGSPGVPLDDLVEPLAREAAAAVVEEQGGLHAVAGQTRAPPAGGRARGGEGGGGRGGGGGAERREPLLGALAARAQDAGLEIHVTDLEA